MHVCVGTLRYPSHRDPQNALRAGGCAGSRRAACVNPNASKTQPLAKAFAMRCERLTRREVIGHPQPRLAAGADQQGGPMKQFEAERLHALQQGHNGVLPGAAPLGGTGLEVGSWSAGCGRAPRAAARRYWRRRSGSGRYGRRARSSAARWSSHGCPAHTRNTRGCGPSARGCSSPPSIRSARRWDQTGRADSSWWPGGGPSSDRYSGSSGNRVGRRALERASAPVETRRFAPPPLSLRPVG